MAFRERIASCGMMASIVAAGAVAGAQAPQGVSPGGWDRDVAIAGGCPTFNWQEVEGAAVYELAVYELPVELDLRGGRDLDLTGATEVIYTRVPGGATGWTPALEQCLAAGGRYAWFVRAVIDPESGMASEWSLPRVFSVSPTPSAEEVRGALGVLRRFVEAGETELEERAPDFAEIVELAGGESPSMGRMGADKTVRGVPGGAAAVRGEQPDPAGETYGLAGLSASADGAGVGAANLGGGPDLVLDGSSDGTPDAHLRESGIDRRSSVDTTFTIGNTGGGGMTLQVNGVVVGDGSGLTGITAEDADTLDGQHGAFYRDASNLDAGMLSVNLYSARADLQSEDFLGNGTGDIAQNNGVRQLSLNADFLDGQHGDFYRDAGSLNAGVLSVDRYSARADLQSEGLLGDEAGDIAQNNGVRQPHLDADTLDGEHGGYYRNASNISSGTLATPRYSARADLAAEGYLGDAPDDIAQNNGVLQQGLNADRLDGLDSAFYARTGHSHSDQTWTTPAARGLWLSVEGADGKALWGEASADSGLNYGVYGTATAPSSIGVYGRGMGAGVHGFTLHDDGAGVIAQASGRGVGLAAYSGVGNLIEAYDGEPGDSELRFKVTNAGDVLADGIYTSPAADFAEMLPASGDVAPGDVLAVNGDGRLVRSSQPFEPAVAGVYSTRPAYVGGGDHLGEEGYAALAMVGVVPVNACAEGGAIRPGDLLTSSSTPGHAMRAGSDAPQGTVIGKALEGLAAGCGQIRMLVVLQ